MGMLINLLLTLSINAQVSGWEAFADTRFKWKWSDEYGAEIEIPIFTKELQGLEGKEITLTGHYLPFKLENERIIISQLPYAACFFCGGGVGQESVAEIEFNSVQRPFRMDEVITVKGKLRLNVDNYERLVFILENAKVVQP